MSNGLYESGSCYLKSNYTSRKERKCSDTGSLSFLPQEVGRSRWETFMVSAFTASYQTKRAASNPGLSFPHPAV